MIKKKGRKPKSYYENLKLDNSLNQINNLESNTIINTDKQPEEKVVKKRGRKPKGGKIVEVDKLSTNKIPTPNIILHLNCFSNEIDDLDNIKYDPNINNINNFNINDVNSLNYNYIDNTQISNNNINTNTNTNNINNCYEISNMIKTDIFKEESIIKNADFTENKDIIIKDDINKNELSNKNISKKLKELYIKLKHKDIDTKASCFWCTYPFDNEAIYIPKYEVNKNIFCYGNFCSPECACSHLMNENIDSSSKFERYYLLNNIYGKIYNYDKNIKPAPNPHYLLKKFYGNLDIQEYRKLLENERLLLVIDKPLTRLLPDIHEENEDTIINSKIRFSSSSKR
jgi:hypothetical protein